MFSQLFRSKRFRCTFGVGYLLKHISHHLLFIFASSEIVKEVNQTWSDSSTTGFLTLRKEQKTPKFLEAFKISKQMSERNSMQPNVVKQDMSLNTKSIPTNISNMPSRPWLAWLQISNWRIAKFDNSQSKIYNLLSDNALLVFMFVYVYLCQKEQRQQKKRTDEK